MQSSRNNIDVKETFLSIAESALAQKSALPWCYRVFSDAPNPGIAVDGVGVLGLPVGIRESQFVQEVIQKRASASTPDSQPSSWSLSATQFTCKNPNWSAFFEQLSRWAGTAFGFDASANKVVLANQTLRWHGVGSTLDLSTSSDQEKESSAKVATISILLPSLFSGGTVHARHTDFAEDFHLDAGVPGDTAVLFMHKDSSLTSEPLITGACLTLSFDLVLSVPPTPGLPPPESKLFSRLGALLQSWNTARRSTAPSKLVCLLQNTYSQADIRRSALRGPDAYLATVLETCAEAHGFRLGLAILTCRVSKSYHKHVEHDNHRSSGFAGSVESAEEECPLEDVSAFAPPAAEHTTTSPTCVYHYEAEDEKIRNTGSRGSDPDIESLSSSRFSTPNYCPIHTKPKGSLPPMRIGSLLDLSGNVIREKMDYDQGTAVVPTALHNTLVASPNALLQWDLGDWKRHLLLVIWPSWADFDLAQGSKAFAEACERLRTTDHVHPTADELELVDLVLAYATAESVVDVRDSACRVACLWRSLDIWVRAVKTCDASRSIGTLGSENSHNALKVFGFEAIQATLESALSRDPSDLSALHFLRDFARRLDSGQSIPRTPAITQWITEQTSLRFAMVRTRIDAFIAQREDAAPEAVVEIVQAVALGGQPSLLFDDLVLKIDASMKSDIIRALVNELYAQRATLDPSSQTLHIVIPGLLLKFVNSVDLESVSSETRVKDILASLTFCLSAGDLPSCSTLLDRVVHPAWTIDDRVEYVKGTLAPLLARLPSLVARRRQTIYSPTFVAPIQTMLLEWANTVMGPRPDDSSTVLANLEEQLAKWTCACEPCIAVRHFLTHEPESEKDWERIGGQKRKHVEKFVKLHAAGIATSEAIMTRPQGIRMIKDDNVVRDSVRWTVYQAWGKRLLRGVSSDPETLVGILGPNAATIATLYSGQSTNNDSSGTNTESTIKAFATLLGRRPMDQEAFTISVDDSDISESDSIPPSASMSRATGSPSSYASIPSRSRSLARASSPSDLERPNKRLRAAYDAENLEVSA